MDGFSYHQLKRDMNELDIDKAIRDEVLALCHVINPVTDINPSNPSQIKKVKIGKKTFEQSTEVFPGDSFGQSEYCVRLKINENMTLSIAYAPHSTPVLVVDVETPAGIHRHMSDAKNDNTVEYAHNNIPAWLKRIVPTSMTSDSTGATRAGRNITEAQRGAAIDTFLDQYPNDCLVFSGLGSNIAALSTLIARMGQHSGKRKTLIVDGKAVTDLIRDADKADMKSIRAYRKWAKDKYNIDILFASQKSKTKPFIDDPTRHSEYAYYVTGTQDEFGSVLNRAARGMMVGDRYIPRKGHRGVMLQSYIPTGDNKFRRLEQKDMFEIFHDIPFHYPEIVEKEAANISHSSGHNNVEDKKDEITWSSKPIDISIVTARGDAPAIRALETLYGWGYDISASAHFLGGKPKQPVLQVISDQCRKDKIPCEFLDDQGRNIAMGKAAGLIAGQVPGF